MRSMHTGRWASLSLRSPRSSGVMALLVAGLMLFIPRMVAAADEAYLREGPSGLELVVPSGDPIFTQFRELASAPATGATQTSRPAARLVDSVSRRRVPLEASRQTRDAITKNAPIKQLVFHPDRKLFVDRVYLVEVDTGAKLETRMVGGSRYGGLAGYATTDDVRATAESDNQFSLEVFVPSSQARRGYLEETGMPTQYGLDYAGMTVEGYKDASDDDEGRDWVKWHWDWQGRKDDCVWGLPLLYGGEFGFESTTDVRRVRPAIEIFGRVGKAKKGDQVRETFELFGLWAAREDTGQKDVLRLGAKGELYRNLSFVTFSVKGHFFHDRVENWTHFIEAEALVPLPEARELFFQYVDGREQAESKEIDGEARIGIRQSM